MTPPVEHDPTEPASPVPRLLSDVDIDVEGDVEVVPAPRVAPPASGRHGAVGSILRSGGARLAVLPISAVLGIVCTRLIISHYGEAAYAQYGLLVGLINLLPFADLGMAAAIMNAVAASDDPRRDEQVHGVLVTSMRVLFCSMVAFVLVAVVLGVTGVWPTLLGAGLQPGTGSLVASLCLAVIGLSLALGFGQRILSGLGRNHLSVLLLGLQTPIMLVVLVVMTSFDLPGGAYIAVLAYLVTFGLAGLTSGVAARQIAPAVGRAIRAAPHLRTERGGAVLATAWPTLVQLIALPVALQTDRIVLSHVSSLEQLAKYNLASQMFTPVGGVVTAAGFALWPVFARARAHGTRVTSPLRLALGFGAATAGVCGLIVLVSPWLADRASGSTIGLSLPLVLAFSGLMVCQALKNPLGQYMTDARGLRFQAYIIPTVLVPMNLVLSWLGARAWGAPGPVVGSIVSVLLCQVVANWLYVRRELARRAPELDRAQTPA